MSSRFGFDKVRSSRSGIHKGRSTGEREDYSTNEDGEGIPQGRGEHVKLPVPIEGIGDKVLDQLISIGEN